MDKNGNVLCMKFDNLTEEECHELVEAINGILKENGIKDYQITYGTIEE